MAGGNPNSVALLAPQQVLVMKKPHWANLRKKPPWAARAGKRSLLVDSAPPPRTLVRTWATVEEVRVKLCRLPEWWVALVCASASTIGPADSLLHGVEVFSGAGHLSAAFKRIVGAWASFEVQDDESENILAIDGVKLLLRRVLLVGLGGLVWLGTPCKSWVGLSRSFTMRTTSAPQGPVPALCSAKQRRYLKEHNCIAEISALLLQTATHLGLDYCLEQPLSSLLFRYRAVRKALLETDAVSCYFQMNSLCGDSPKPLRLMTTAKFMSIFKEVTQRRKVPLQKTRKRLVTTGSNGSFTGNHSALRESSAYTPCMGVALALCYQGRDVDNVLAALSLLGY